MPIFDAPPVGTGVSEFDLLTDVDITGRADGYALYYDQASDKLKYQAFPGGLSDIVDDITPQLGGILDANGFSIDMGVNSITDTKVGQWDTAYGWGDHSSAGYLTSETSHADVVVDGDFIANGIMVRTAAGVYSTVTDNSSNWNTAYGWGDHSGLYASTAQGALADSATQPGDDADTLGSGVATDGQVLTADGAGNAAWEDVAGGASQLSDLSDVNTSTPTNRNALMADGVDWESRALVEADISDLGTYLTSVAFGDLTSTPTTLAGYGITDAATSAQGTLADSATQPGDDADTLGSGTATDGQVLTADGATGAAWEDIPNQTECLIVACSDETTDLTTGTGKVTFRMPYAMTLSEVKASVTTAPVGSTIQVDINESGTTILSTVISIDASEKTSKTAATAPVISDSSLADDAEITIDVDQVGSTTAGAGLKVYLIGART